MNNSFKDFFSDPSGKLLLGMLILGILVLVYDTFGSTV